MSSGDPRLDRRYDYARAALEDSDAATAADVLEQTVAQAPQWAEAWHLLGQARELLGDKAGAIAAFREARAHDAKQVLGAAVDLARLGALDPAAATEPAYVAQLFDEYAPRFDRHLRKNLAYRAPEILFEMVLRAAGRLPRALTFGRTLDLGCGTGLAGEVFRARCAALHGVDLSPKMIEAARKKHVYATLTVGDLVPALGEEAAGETDLVLAADVFVYLGDLAPVFGGVCRALTRDGLFAFTVQALACGDMAVGPDKRFAHSQPYLERALAGAGLRPLLIEAVVPRMEAGEPVAGLAIVATHA